MSGAAILSTVSPAPAGHGVAAGPDVGALPAAGLTNLKKLIEST